MKRYILPLLITLLAGANARAQTTVFSYTGGVQTFTAPYTGIISVDMAAGKGGDLYLGGFTGSIWYANAGGSGGRVVCLLSVTAGQILNILAGGQGQTQTGSGSPAAGGFNSGGTGSTNGPLVAGGGGGASYITIGGMPVVIVGAGGGGGWDGTGTNGESGGMGGGLVGENGYNNFTTTLGADGGSQTSGGASGYYGGSSGSFEFSGGNGGQYSGGGGGGGYYGGGGGQWSGGGGGSSYTSPSLVTAFTHTQGYNTGNGYVAVTVLYYFVNGSVQSLPVCANSGATTITSLLSLNDPTTGLTDTWTATGPSHGALSGLPATATSASGTVTPSGPIMYTPTAGYHGTDAFTVTASNGSQTTTTIVNVTVGPTVTISSSPAAICQGGTTAGLGGSFGGGAISAVWTSSDALGSFAGNGGATPGTATYIASASSPTPVTLTLTTSGGSCGTTFATTSLTVNPNYTITASAGAHGSISPSGVTTLCSTSSQAYTISASSGYHVSGLTVDGGSVTPATSYNFSSVSANHTISATFAPDCTQPTVPTVSASVSSLCGSGTSTLSIASGTLNGATAWHWYSGSCGGTPVGTGTSVSVSLSGTTTYYVRGEGGCATPGSCGNTTITVLPTAGGVISGPNTVGSGAVITLTDVPGGGTWSTANPLIATIDASGHVTGQVVGGDNTIFYTISNSCGTGTASYAVHVNSNVCIAH